MLFFLRMMRRVAIQTTNVAARMTGFRKVRLRMAFTVAGQTASAGLLPRSPLKNEYLVLVAAPSHVVGSRPVAPFAALVRWSAFRVKRRLPVRCLFPVVVDLFVAGLAGLCADILRHLGEGLSRRGGGCRLSATGLGVLVRDLLTSLARSGGNDEKTQSGQE